jgi:uncharacterized membrane protein
VSWILSLEAVYALTGLLLWSFAALTPRPGARLFWFVLGFIFCFGGVIPYHWTGMLVVLLVTLDGFGQVAPAPRSQDLDTLPEPLGRQVFVPVLIIPAVTLSAAAIARFSGADVSRSALVGLGYGSVLAMLVGLALTRASQRTLLEEGRRINEAMGALSILPQLLAALGIVFTAAGVGDLIAGGILQLVDKDDLFLLVVANCLGMTVFTLIMGNSFAAFPVIASGVLIPLIVKPFGVDPAMAAILTLTAGSTGTLMTPMAANFNIVPTALLQMRDTNAVIRFQVPFALLMWVGHVVLLYGMIRLT